MVADSADRLPRVVGRYVVHDELASGGMASVHIGRLMGPVGFSRTVAIKILHPHFAKDPEFVAMFVDEARLAARIRHPNVVATLDVVAKGKDLLLVMDYVPGETLARLMRLAHAQGRQVPPSIVSAIIVDLLDGLHAAHEARDERGQPLAIVHRDVSPQNVMVGHDGTARVLDFGIANATFRIQTTRDGELKGKFAYMAPEQVRRQKVDRRTDLFAASVVLWEALTGLRLFAAENPLAIAARIVGEKIVPPSTLVGGLSSAIDEVVLKGLSRDRETRYATANEFARALENAIPTARRSDVRAWVFDTAQSLLEQRARRVADIENTPSYTIPPLAEEELLTDVGQTDIPIVHADLEVGARVSGVPRTPAPAPAKRGIWVPILGGLGISTCVVLILLFRHGTAERPPLAVTPPATLPVGAAPLPSAAAATSVPASSASSGPQVPATADAPSPPDSQTQPATAASATSSPGRNALPTASPPAVTPMAVPRVSHGNSVHTSNPCDPPFTISDTGVKRWKPACL